MSLPEPKTLADPFIFKVLDVSTSHLTSSDNESLRAEAAGGVAPVYELAEYGWLVYTEEIEDNWPSPEMSSAFLEVLKTAKALGCAYVRFDRDGREYPEFQQFDW